MGLLTDAHGRGVFASRPAAGHAGREYYSTDTLVMYRDNGSSWDAQSTSATRASLGLDTTDSPQFAGINLGHASDTTLARASAGVVSIEGVNIVKAGAATGSGLTMATARLLGRSTASTGAIEEIAVGTGLSLSGGTLAASGGSAASDLASAQVNLTSGDFTITSATFADVTGATVTLTTGAHRCLVSADFLWHGTALSSVLYLDIDVDGTRIGGTNGVWEAPATTASSQYSVNVAIATDALTAASHTIKLVCKNSGSGGITFHANSTNKLRLTVVELYA